MTDFIPFLGFEVRCGKRHENIPKNQNVIAPYRTGCELVRYISRQEGWEKTSVVDLHWDQMWIQILVRLNRHKVLRKICLSR